jgi:plastocyanin
MCRGGDPSRAATGCPVPPVQGPPAYDGRSYFSLGALLPGETRELPLAPDLAPGTYRFTCAVHPDTHVHIEVVEDPSAPARLPPLDAAAAVRAVADPPSGEDRQVVVLGPQPPKLSVEVLAATPGSVHIPVGGTVTWRVDGRSPHTVELGVDHPPHLADTAAADTAPTVPHDDRWDGTNVVRSGVLSADPSVDRTTFSLTFIRPGTYRAYDRFHAGISTVVNVG